MPKQDHPPDPQSTPAPELGPEPAADNPGYVNRERPSDRILCQPGDEAALRAAYRDALVTELRQALAGKHFVLFFGASTAWFEWQRRSARWDCSSEGGLEPAANLLHELLDGDPLDPIEGLRSVVLAEWSRQRFAETRALEHRERQEDFRELLEELGEQLRKLLDEIDQRRQVAQALELYVTLLADGQITVYQFARRCVSIIAPQIPMPSAATDGGES